MYLVLGLGCGRENMMKFWLFFILFSAFVYLNNAACTLQEAEDVCGLFMFTFESLQVCLAHGSCLINLH